MSAADFAAARTRLTARRQTQQQPPPSQLPSPLLRLPPSIRTLLTSSNLPQPSLRVPQLDAELLDEELLSLFKTQVADGLKYFDQHVKDDYDAEISLALRALLWKFTLWDHDASYGASLQGLHYVDARTRSGHHPGTRPTATQKVLYGLVGVGGRYAWSKVETRLFDTSDSSRWMQRLSRLTSLATSTHAFASLVSFAVFLLNGRYRTLLDRALHMRLTPSSAHTNREVSFEYLNRQLVWHAFTEFLLFLLPLVGIARWRRWLSRVWRRFVGLFRGGAADEVGEKNGELAFLPERTCAICYQDQNPVGAEGVGGGGGVQGSAMTDVTNPYMAECGCVYCFVCLAQRLDAEEGEGWCCLRCGSLVKECGAWHGDVVIEDVMRRGEEGSEGEIEDGEGVGGHEENVIEGGEVAEVGVSWVQANGEAESIYERKMQEGGHEEEEDPGASLVA